MVAGKNFGAEGVDAGEADGGVTKELDVGPSWSTTEPGEGTPERADSAGAAELCEVLCSAPCGELCGVLCGELCGAWQADVEETTTQVAIDSEDRSTSPRSTGEEVGEDGGLDDMERTVAQRVRSARKLSLSRNGFFEFESDAPRR